MLRKATYWSGAFLGVVLTSATLCAQSSSTPSPKDSDNDFSVNEDFIEYVPVPRDDVGDPQIEQDSVPPAKRQNPSYSRSLSPRLGRLPFMFGDNSMSVFAATGANDITMELPFFGAGEHLKLAENGSAIPVERTYFNYNHFHHALQANRGPPGAAPTASHSFHVDRYVFGWERLTNQGNMSTEVRLSFTGSLDVTLPAAGGGAPNLTMDGTSIGNLGLIRKRILHASSDFVSTIGMGISIPTGEDLHISLPTAARSITVQNSSVRIFPFVALASAPNDVLFYQGAIQLDIDLNGNRIDVLNTTTGASSTGVWQNQTTLFADFSAGWWWFRDDTIPVVTGLASLVELHYTTALESSDRVVSFGGAPTFQNMANRYDVLNASIGLHLEISRGRMLRVGAAFPITGSDDRFFDSELIFQIVTRPF